MKLASLSCEEMNSFLVRESDLDVENLLFSSVLMTHCYTLQMHMNKIHGHAIVLQGIIEKVFILTGVLC